MGSGHITKYQINLDLIKIIKFCLKIYDLLRHPPMGGDVSTNHKSSNRIELCRLGQDLFNC